MKPYRIPSASMEPTLAIGQRILVNRVAAGSRKLHIGEIIVFHPPADYGPGCADPAEGASGAGQPGGLACDVARSHPSTLTFVKRVAGIPGDRISIRDGYVIRTGAPERGPSLNPCRSAAICNFSGTIKIPADEYFMMGDNRGQADDSRLCGTIRGPWIIGARSSATGPPTASAFCR